MEKFDFPLSSTLKNFSNNAYFKELLSKFEAYKKESAPGEIARPTRAIQEEYIGIDKALGRDRFFKNPDDAKDFELTHLHVYDGTRVWKDIDGENKAQWYCTSDRYLVYSYFKHNDTHVFYIIAFIPKDAHELTKDLENGQANPIVKAWLKQAKEFQKNY